MKTRNTLFALALMLAPMLAFSQAALPSYSVSRLPAGLTPIDINNAGAIIGFMSTNFGEHGFILQNGVVTDLGTLTGSTGQFASPARLNARAQVTGWSLIASGEQRAFLYFQGAMRELGTLGGSHSAGNAINDGGVVVGFAETGNGDDRHAFAYWHDSMRDLGTLGGRNSVANAVNRLGAVVGDSAISMDPLPDTHAFLHQNGVMSDLGALGGTYASALAVNDRGQVAGHARMADETWRMFLYQDGFMRNLGSLGGNYIAPFDLNERGAIVGIAERPGEPISGFLYYREQLLAIDSLIDPALGWHIIWARSINDHGQIVGYGCRDEVCGAVLLTPGG